MESSTCPFPYFSIECLPLLSLTYGLIGGLGFLCSEYLHCHLQYFGPEFLTWLLEVQHYSEKKNKVMSSMVYRGKKNCWWGEFETGILSLQHTNLMLTVGWEELICILIWIFHCAEETLDLVRSLYHALNLQPRREWTLWEEFQSFSNNSCFQLCIMVKFTISLLSGTKCFVLSPLQPFLLSIA